MANYTLYGYAFGDVTASGGYSVGQELQLDPTWDVDSDQLRFEISSGDSYFDGDDTNDEVGRFADQTGTVYDASGGTVDSGQIYLEESYTLSDGDGGTITVYAVEIGGGEIGFVSDTPLVPGTTYTITSVDDVTFLTAPEYTEFAAPTFDHEAGETYQGGAYEDVFDGGAGNDTFSGGAGNDTFYIDEDDGTDSIDGGAGWWDCVSLKESGSGQGVTVTYTDSNDFTYDFDGTTSGGTALNISQLETTNYDDTIDASANTADSNFVLYAGNDTIVSGSGNDNIWAGAGDDTITGGGGFDNLYGEEGNDTFLFEDGWGGDTVDGGADFDTLDFSNVSATVTVTYTGDGAGYASVDGSNYVNFTGIEQIIGTAQAETIDVSADSLGVTVDAGGGDDTIVGGSGADVLDGGAGSDNISYAGSDAGVTVDLSTNTASGGDAQGDTISGFENINGSDFNDTLTGDSAVNWINSGAGNDTIDGGGGDDVLDGAAGDDTIDGGAGDDVIAGGLDNDTIQGGTGADILDGGDGIDTLSYEDSSAGVVVNFGDNTVSGGDGAGDTISNFENATGSDYDDRLYGSTADNVLSAGAGNDNLSGQAGDDTLYGGAGDDYLQGGSNNDTLYGGADDDDLWGGSGNDDLYGEAGEDDFFTYEQYDTSNFYGGDDWDTAHFLQWTETDGVTVTYSGDQAFTYLYNGSEAGNGTATDIEEVNTTDNDDTLDASLNTHDSIYNLGAGDDSFTGGSGSEQIYLGEGTDTAYGNDGADTFFIEDNWGSDTVFGGSGVNDNDTIDFSNVTTGGVTVTFTGSEDGTATEGGNSLSFDGIEAVTGTDFADVIDAGSDASGLTLSGGGGSDTITGSGGADTIDGGSGADTITGGEGDDTVTLGADNDIFVFGDGDGQDTITDFDLNDSDLDGSTNDQIDVSGLQDAEGNPVNAWDADVSDDGSGNAVLSFPNGESITLLGVAPGQVDSAPELHAMGIPCFTKGTRILTPSGEKPIERLKEGDMVCTMNAGPQPLMWIGKSRIGRGRLDKSPELKPICIRTGTLGNEGDLLVSPNHGLVLPDPKSGAGAFKLVRAAHLLELCDGRARQALGKKEVIYYHLLLPQHGIVFANGIPSESLYPGPEALTGFDAAAKAELFTLFPVLSSILAARDAKDLVAQVYGDLALPFAPRKSLIRGDIILPPRA